MLVAKKTQELSFYDRSRTRRKIQEKRQANLRLATKKLRMFGVLFTIAIMSILLVAHYTCLVQVNNQIEKASRELRALHNESEHLQLEIASLRSPERVETLALQFGLQHPRKDQFVILTAGVNGN